MSAYQTGLRLSAEGRHTEAIAQYEAALAVQPDDAKVLFALGNTAHALGLAAPAEQFFRRVLALEPEREEALVNLANLLRATGQFDAAIALLQPALAREPESPELQLTLGSAFREKGDALQAKAHYRAALAARPAYVPALANLADMLCDDGAREQARTLYDQALKTEPKNPQVRLNRAILHLLNSDLKNGWRDYAARVEIPGKVPQIKSGTEQRLAPWTGGNLKGKRLLVRSEQGVGDQILFASLIPDLLARAKAEGGSVILECEPRLVPLFARSFPGALVKPAAIRGESGKAIADYGWLKAVGGANAAVLIGDLPRYLRGSLESFPAPHSFLTPDTDEVSRWKRVFGGNAVGICWRSGKLGGHRSLGFARLEAWGDFLRRVEATIVSVQYDGAAEEIAALEAISGRKLIVPEGIDQKTELDRACALMAALGLVVSAPTAVSWLSAGAGVPTLKLLYGEGWTALGQTHEPFAPACRCVIPQQFGDWDDVFRQAAALITSRS
jgi:tetratricopeptide (TPR) repeat protein